MFYPSCFLEIGIQIWFLKQNRLVSGVSNKKFFRVKALLNWVGF
ncbi:46158_t:CDS:2 [Gigaspora margarita]|uniref:46158_t:CDS:1 n=1 Tax=Gigaspora margarita TaxID=4874 RepID=A0ABN7ULH7_GIGMA|nr:46158_t:CDS:2 [Gigaspora margarita]